MLHDIGKIAVPDTILGKPGSLTEEEWKVMRSHSAYGEQLVNDTPGLQHLAKAIRAEHERWDGGGYPDGLAGEKIPLASRITFVCDAYDAMTSDRPYRPALSPDAAKAEIVGGIGGQFCPRSARAFLEVLEEGRCD
jgi:HD-GYP domain-containing protein (c-di-GMP phosphodiesterase class II)